MFLTNIGHLPSLSQIHPLLRLPCPHRKPCCLKASRLPSSPSTPRTSPATGAPSQVSLSCPPPSPDYLRARGRQAPRNPRTKSRPPTAQRRPTPSWQPPPPQRPRSLSIGLFLFSESNLPHVSSQNPRSVGHLPTPSGASLRHVGPAPGPAQSHTIRLA